MIRIRMRCLGFLAWAAVLTLDASRAWADRGPSAARPETPAASTTSLPTELAPAIEAGAAAASLAPTSLVPTDVGGPLEPGQTIQPIDLVSALRLAGARDLDVAIARQRVARAMGELDEAQVLWLPSLFLGPNWIRHDGQAQIVEGAVRSINKSSLFLGGTAAVGQGVTGPIPAGGPAQVGGLTTVLRISDAIFTPLAARQDVEARRAGLRVASNDAMLGAAEAYLDLQRAAGRLAIAREAVAQSEMLSQLTASYVRSGAGLEADHRRVLTERDRRRKEIEEAVGELEVASAELVRRTRLDPRLVVAPVEPAEAVIRLIPDGCPIDGLIVMGLRHRPELCEARALVEATLVRLRQAKLRPLIPSLSLRYSGGGFGGGPNSFFGDFSGRSDADVNLFWEVQNLGFGDRAIIRQRAADERIATLQYMKIQDRVAAQVVSAEKGRLAAERRMREAARAVPEAITSLQLNLRGLRQGAGLPGATRPLEVLQPIQALAQSRTDYLEGVLAYDRAQFRLYHALGQPPESATLSLQAPPSTDRIPAPPG